MNKNKKIVALICAMAMIFSMFASFTVVNAEEITKGIVLEYDTLMPRISRVVLSF